MSFVIFQALAERAEMCAALTNNHLFDRRAAACAWFTRLVVNIEVILVAARFTVAIAVIAQRTAAILDALEQREANARMQASHFVVGQAIRQAKWVQLRIPQRFVGVDIANPGNDRLVEQ